MYLGFKMGLFNFLSTNYFSKSAKKSRQKTKLLIPKFANLFDSVENEWVCLDLEMTGLNPKTDYILSVGAIKIVKEHNIFRIDTANMISLICLPPTMPNMNSIIIHGLRPIDVENGIHYAEMMDILLSFIGGRTIVGFCTDIDLNFLNTIIKPYLGINLPNNAIDVSTMEQRFRQKNSKNPDIIIEKKHLNTLLNEHKIPRLPSHDALNDAMMTAMLFCHLEEINSNYK